MRLIDADALKARFIAGQAYFTEPILVKIDSAPTIEAEPKKNGRWINIKVSTTGESSAECSECGAIVHTAFTSTVNYCLNCGAKMGDADD